MRFGGSGFRQYETALLLTDESPQTCQTSDMRLLVLALVAFCSEAADQRFTDELWNGIRPIYAQTLRHFLRASRTARFRVRISSST